MSSGLSSNTSFPVSIILYNVRSLYNVGSIFRTCDATNIEKLILTGYTPHPPRKEIYKTALGATDTVKWSYYKDINDAINDERQNGKQIVAVELTNKSKPHTILAENKLPICLILGNELSGIDDIVLEQCDYAVQIPMHGIKHSLNVSVVAGIVLYEAIKNVFH